MEERSNQFSIAVAFGALLLPFIFFGPQFGSASGLSISRYGLYLFPAVAIVIIMFKQKMIIRVPPVIFLIAYVATSIIATAVAGVLDWWTIRDFYVISSIIIFASIKAEYDDRSINLFVGIFLLAFLLATTFGIVNAPKEFNFFMSSGLFESTLGYSSGLLATFLLITRRYVAACIVLVVCVLSFKKAAILGIFAATFFFAFCHLVYRLKISNARRAVSIAAFLASVSMLAIVAVYLEATIDFLFSLFGVVEVTPERFLMGRVHLRNLITDAIGQSSPLELLFGHGLAATDRLISASSNLTNPHNDYLKIFYDYGALGTLVFIAGMVSVYRRDIVGMSLFVYIAATMVTSNVILYLDVQYLGILLLNSSRGRSPTLSWITLGLGGRRRTSAESL